ncbi:MAG: hypothetical protein L6R40_005019 [Gallowayella cf. fulva]|nr:MAG: hypothetical protein L6R40_005019 [Xanthomendoza cf. fulva]
MGSTSSPAPEYWGYLVKADKSPSILFEHLLLGIANYINRQIAPWDVSCLTPPKLAAFYRLLGGDYDPLFLETPPASLSFIYQSLGCFHTLQPEKDPYSPPSVPALTAQGFVRWQTVQLLLDPDEHASFLQNAVKRFDIINPADGIHFPHRLPRDALPSRPDPEMIQWHEGVADNLMIGSPGADARAPSLAGLSDSTTENSIASWEERDSIIYTAPDLTHPRPGRPFRPPPPSLNLPQSIDPPPIGNNRVPHPWHLERRRCSTSRLYSPTTSPFPPHSSIPSVHPVPNSLYPSRPRSLSIISTSSVSSSSSSSLTTSSASMSPRHHSSSHHHTHPQHHQQPQNHRPPYHERRHSSHGPYSPRAIADARDVQAHRTAHIGVPPQQPPRPAGSNARGWSAQWGETGAVVDSVQCPVNSPNQGTLSSPVEPQRRSNEDENGVERARSGSGTRPRSPMRGVGGRKYAANGTSWS